MFQYKFDLSYVQKATNFVIKNNETQNKFMQHCWYEPVLFNKNQKISWSASRKFNDLR